ncbi:MAG: hypothetical protein HY015_06170 [Bacteroidetes bacterium]|nr:hypothetical protein [Bacteroidota bacterium]MBI3482548.1 hypothetical protein [Bacteroidota bacterium]
MDNVNSKQATVLSQNFNSFLRLMQEGLIVLDPSGYVVDVYEAAGKIFGTSNHNELVGRHFSDLY